MSVFATAIAADTPAIVLDGGLGTRLETRGNDVSSVQWSARLLVEAPDEVESAHCDYFRAGARVATTCSYQVSANGFDEFWKGAELDRRVDQLLRLSVALADRARSRAELSSEQAWIAASVGPFGASRADGSEYTGDYDVSVEALRDWHRPRLHTLADTNADVLLCETIPCLAEVAALCAEFADMAEVANHRGERAKPFIMSISVANGALRSGESIGEAVRLAEAAGALAVGVNCSSVADATAALRTMREHTSLPFVVYPNSGEHWHAASRSWSGAIDGLAGAVPEWIDLGARLIGGCCRVDTHEITEIARAIETA